MPNYTAGGMYQLYNLYPYQDLDIPYEQYQNSTLNRNEDHRVLWNGLFLRCGNCTYEQEPYLDNDYVNVVNDNEIHDPNPYPTDRVVEASAVQYVVWPPILHEPPPVINSVLTTTQNIATQYCRDESPDKFILTPEEQKAFRKLYPLRKNLLPSRRPEDTRPTLVLDLDETLIHTTFEVPADQSNNLEKLFVSTRPYLRAFLRSVSDSYEIVIYTASLPAYADKILDGIDPDRSIFSHRLYREHCSFYKGIYIKDIETLGRPLDKTVFVDNFPGAYMMQPTNALPVRSFVGASDDNELYTVTKLLNILKTKDDVRPMLNRYRNHWKKVHFSSDKESED